MTFKRRLVFRVSRSTERFHLVFCIVIIFNHSLSVESVAKIVGKAYWNPSIRLSTRIML